MESLRELYKIGRGPSSSHTMGPFKAARQFKKLYPHADAFKVKLMGSLALTGKGHMTDTVIAEALGEKITEITFDKAGAVSVIYDGRINIEFGMPTNLSQKVQVAASMISEGKIARNEAGTLDLSINERAVFTPDYLISSD